MRQAVEKVRPHLRTVSRSGQSQAVSMWEWPVRETDPPSGSGAMAARRPARSARDSRTMPGPGRIVRLQVDRQQRVLERRREKL